MTVRSMIVGVRIKQDTTVTVTLGSSEAEAKVRFAKGSDLRFQSFEVTDGRAFRQRLPLGDYVVIVDCDSNNRPISLATDVDVAFWSNDRRKSGDLPEQVTWVGQGADVREVKDPWPKPPLVQALPGDAFLASFLTSHSPIAGTMAQMLDTFTGKGAASGTSNDRKKYALLIGIDRYNDGPGHDGVIYKDLQGCVYDVLAIEKLLRAKVPGIDITLMIAPRPGGPGSDRQVPENRRPTYKNIVATWKAMTAAARPGDIVYIHVSSHGGRTPTRFPEVKPARPNGAPGLDESLVPCDINDTERGRYLRDIEIALLLRQMAQRELITTLVLDSCHSGDATRGDQAQARHGEREDDRPRASGSLGSDVGTREELAEMAAELAHIPVGPAWRVNAELGRAISFTTVIAACRGPEVAYEYAPEGEARCGALTYFWRKALDAAGETTTYRQLYDQVFGNVRDVFATQSPVLLGEPARVVFEASVVRQVPSVPVSVVNGAEVVLRAGAPVLGVGMHLALVPPDRLPELDELARWPEVEVTHVVDGFRSVARRVPGTGLDETGKERAIVVGAQGIVRSYPAIMQRTVRLPAPLEVPGELLDRLANAIQSDTSKLVRQVDSNADYQVLVRDAWLEICDPGGVALPHVPRVPIRDAGAAPRVVDQLVHLARYSNVSAFANHDPTASLTGKLHLEVLALPGYDPAIPASFRPAQLAPGPATFEDGQYFCLRVRNDSSQDLQIAIFDLQSNWAIDTLVPDQPQLAPRECRDLRLRAQIPHRDPAVTTGWDILKVLATKSTGDPVNYGLVTLRPIGETYQAKGPRAADDPPLDQLLGLLQEPTAARRTVEFASTPSCGWTIAQTRIEIIRSGAA